MHSDFYRRCFLIVTAVVLGYLAYRIVAPLLGILGWGIVLAFSLYPLHERLTRKFKGRNSLSAGLIAGVTPFVVFVPLSVLGAVFAGQVARIIAYLSGPMDLSYPELVHRLSSYPLIGRSVEWVQENTAVSAEQVQGWITDGLQVILKSAASMGGSVALNVFGTLIGFFIMIFALFFLLRDGRTMVENLVQLVPVERTRRSELLKYLGEVTRAVVFGSTATAVVQGLFVGFGFAFVGLPSPVVFGVIATIAAFLPVGAGIVLVPAVLYLGFSGHLGAATFLAIWTGVMWLLETFMRPLLTARHAQVSTLAIFIGAIGGVAAYGILGLIIGPVLLSFIVALLRFARENPLTST
ncbi:MAG TPA: AI-2E family transporter [Steroidobacteraceae bacterium]|nr:AI-2E family transporter [Steroidobacteraceae bacterium]